MKWEFKLNDFLDKNFSLIIFTMIFIFGLCEIIWIENGLYQGLLYCGISLGGFTNKYIISKKHKINSSVKSWNIRF